MVGHVGAEMFVCRGLSERVVLHCLMLCRLQFMTRSEWYGLLPIDTGFGGSLQSQFPLKAAKVDFGDIRRREDKTVLCVQFNACMPTSEFGVNNAKTVRETHVMLWRFLTKFIEVLRPGLYDLRICDEMCCLYEHQQFKDYKTRSYMRVKMSIIDTAGNKSLLNDKLLFV